MNAEAIMTPGGIADQLTRGLSGLGQSFNSREEMLRQGQRDRIGDDRYTAEMALRERDRQQQNDRQAMMDQRDQSRYADSQTHLHARDALDASRYATQENQRNTEADLNRQTQHPELYQNSPSPQIAHTAQDALGRRQFSDAKAGYIPQDQMHPMPGSQDWRVPMEPGEPMYGPTPGTPAWQGQRAGEVLRESKQQGRETPEQRAIREAGNIDRSVKGRADIASLQQEGRNLTALRTQRDKLRGEIDSQGLGRPTIGADKPLWFTGDYEAPDLAAWDGAHPRHSEAQKQYDALDTQIKSMESAQGQGQGQQAAPPAQAGGNWMQRAATGMKPSGSGFSQFVTP